MTPTNQFGDDTVKYRIQIVVNEFFDFHASEKTCQRIVDRLSQCIPPYCAENFNVTVLNDCGVRVRCEVRGEEATYHILPEYQATMPMLPPLTLLESQESARRYELVRKPKAKVVLIVAVARNGTIGKDGKMPWHLPSDLVHFKHTTMGQPLVVGRKTFESMPASVWKTRTPNVLTRDIDSVKMPSPSYNGWHVGNDLASMVHMAAVNYNADAVYIAGGAEIYRQALELDLVDEILVSHIKADYEGDTFFEFVTGFGPGTIELEDDDFSVVRYLRYKPREHG